MMSQRNAFAALFFQDDDVLNRIVRFQEAIETIRYRALPGKKTYQDQRAVIVYLTLRFPEIYYFYKFRMFKSFCEKIHHDYLPVRGSQANIIQFFHLCSVVRDELVENNSLIKLHKDRLGADDYFDVSFNILAQDFIYAVTHYLSIEESPDHERKPILTFTDISLEPMTKEFTFRGKYVDYVSRQKTNKKIGNIGEELVLQYEKENCDPKFRNRIVHKSKTEGDGLGFDILSVDSDGNPKYIEVKTTKGNLETPFFLSGTELQRSIKEGDSYFLYRLYNLCEKDMTAEVQIWQGDLRKYCINPTEYEVILKRTHA